MENRKWLLLVLVAASTLAGATLFTDDSVDQQPADRSGQVHIASVENAYDQEAWVNVMTVDESKAEPVDSYSATLKPGESEEVGLLDCEKGNLTATMLTAIVRPMEEPTEQQSRNLGLTAESCQAGGGPSYRVVADPRQALLVERR